MVQYCKDTTLSVETWGLGIRFKKVTVRYYRWPIKWELRSETTLNVEVHSSVVTYLQSGQNVDPERS